ncbi:PEP/pyruvate-binding domain-containing protein, partial [Streptomyces sp. NPDC058953]|uniref:PEP/pyruvate-binding domain-containing protein n=1 Tax=Streptomyces sp. NPDC058953 TaxID=3346676 RepID=UPI0036A85FF5
MRSGGAVSMPGMMTTVLGVGLTARATAGLLAETGDARFAVDSRLRFLTGWATGVAGLSRESVDRAAYGGPVAGAAATTDRGDTVDADDGGTVGTVPGIVRAVAAGWDVDRLVRARTGGSVPDDAGDQLDRAVASVFSSWRTPRARTYRALHGIPDDRGTAVVVQAMVFGNRDGRSGTGVAFSRSPTTGAPVPYGDLLIGHQGDDVVSGRTPTRPLGELADREPGVWAGLLAALDRLEEHYRDACSVEFTYESGVLRLLQARPGGFAGRAAVAVAVDLAEAGVIDRAEAVLRISPGALRDVRTPRIVLPAPDEVLTRGLGASPGVAVGRLATSAESAVRLAAQGPVVLVRPETSPADLSGLAVAAGVVTARGGTASHAAVVARSLGRAAVVGAARLTVDASGARVVTAGRVLSEGTLIALDGTGGEVVLGRPRVETAAADPRLERLLRWADGFAGGVGEGDRTGDGARGRTEAERLSAARAVLRGTGCAA